MHSYALKISEMFDLILLIIFCLFAYFLGMTHTPENGKINPHHFSGADFYYMDRILPMSIRTLFYSKPESGMRVTEMMACDWSMIIVDVLRCCEAVLCSAVICLFI